MTRKYSSTSVEQLLNATIAAGDTTLSLSGTAAVTALLGGVTLGAGNVDQFTIAIDPDTASEEIIFVRGTSGSTLTGLVRGQAGTAATSHSAGATIKHVLTSNDLDFYTSGVDNALTAAGTATLSNKSISLGSNTVTGTIAQFNTALSDGDFATLAGSETLTNKTLTSPSVSSPSITNNVQIAVSTGLGTTGTINLDFSTEGFKSHSGNLTGNITYTASNYAAGRSVTVRVPNGTTQRTLTFPSSWKFVGVKPANIAASKTGILTVTSFGTTEADCVAAWSAEV